MPGQLSACEARAIVSTVYNHSYIDVVDVTMHMMSSGLAKILGVLLATNGHCSL